MKKVVLVFIQVLIVLVFPRITVEPLSVHDFCSTNRPSKFKIIILPLIDEEINVSGIKFEIKLNDFPEAMIHNTGEKK